MKHITDTIIFLSLLAAIFFVLQIAYDPLYSVADDIAASTRVNYGGYPR